MATTYALNRGWRFGSGAAPGSTEPDFDDAAFATVTLPHANRMLPWHGFDDRDYQFVSVYRRHFRLPAGTAGRVFVDFEGVMTTATVVINGTRLDEHRGGYTPFSVELTEHIRWDGDNVLAVEVDSTERPDVPPFGGRVDYLAFGGIYREAALRVVPETFIADLFAKPVDVLRGDRRVDVVCALDGPGGGRVEVALHDGARTLVTASREVTEGAAEVDVHLTDLGPIDLWDVDRPVLYQVVARLYDGDELRDETTTRIGFREALFTPEGFFLNGRRVQLRGLNRHQTYPYVGGAMPERAQRRDARILKDDLACNVVRTSHYPQSRHFLDCCDETGLLVVEEIPGWQHIGDDEWKGLVFRDVAAMVRRDRNRPSVICWGVRINESRDDHDLYTETNRIAHELDGSRQTGGIRNFAESERLEDVFTMNDFDPDRLGPPNHPLYLVTEFTGHTFPTKPFDNVERVQQHLLRHARVHDMLAADDRYAGGIGWCAFDYNTHGDFGSGDRVCYHGVSDIFRIPKPAAAFYRSQRDPADEVVVEPAFHWAIGDQWCGVPGPGQAVIASNCDVLRVFIGDELITELEPDRDRFPHLAHPPFVTDALAGRWGHMWRELRIDAYVGGELVATRRMSARGVDERFEVEADDAELVGDGRDATRVTLRVTDEFGNRRPFATGAVPLTVSGPGEILGENPFALVGGVGAVWVRATGAGPIRLEARHPVLGVRAVDIHAHRAPDEPV